MPPTLHARQSTPTTPVLIPTAYGDVDSSPSPGAVVGIVLGSVAGALLLLYLVYAALGCAPSVMVLLPATRDMSSVSSFRPRRRGSRAAEVEEVRVPPPPPPPPVVVAMDEPSLADDEVVVIEEHEPRRGTGSRRSRRRSRDRRRSRRYS
ncbi:hypothetical protein NOR_02203 [Metarhizium rileyi]|uniref:Uncharacterized protein n=1 Tax=Metarhizium rileyi (strain RCEF 4871) TaxID=1649241 RepID=A0A167HBE4_METRR|nr:hypothetical protein NOR_02203 [Metarhizium rileyi RCEF 4871]